MSQVIEYTLVVLASTLFVGGSSATLVAYQSFETKAQTGAAFSSLSTLAEQAAMNGSSQAVLFLPNSTVTCRGSTLDMISSDVTATHDLPVSCDFSKQISKGIHHVEFFLQSSTLLLQVT
ncbi:MAG: hypothetical protein OK404_01255 [Thaumarchaeota archaeon]|nr:hypothetical protein [Nitrososphaerota archaeon]